ncbi:TPA: hypothetical protein I8271_005009 [Kluyvera intermedia]|uniref:Uncharacterized protein n=2 Tax=Enterobacteriaceae TaxID=543 RepID=A0AAC8QR69_9ENTR|nr:hypothetical protein [Phytobacter ursingii]HAT2207438.1 hypothetical protein [Kluyvera intermedia]AKL13307.1 hypothetical protein AB182_19320 [Phytobacter ursingii]HAT2518100.1 hypothetical protein [Kluyvera intermedia]HAT2606226.1 hypothetical protein [Kluyvera intermedia]HAT2683014.1 hypothetical protein [Kluyvera intermedia]
MTREDAIRRNAIERLKILQLVNEPDYCHKEADDALCDLLQAIGYSDVVKEFKAIEKWYA